MATAWILNLDADVELEAGPGYAPTRAVLAAMEVHAARLAETLLLPGDVWLRPGSEARGMIGRAFCPTPRALAELRRHGVEPVRAPSFEVLRAVNSRAFLPSKLPGSVFVRELAEATRVLATEPPEGSAWRIKRAFGMAGRGQRVARGDLSFLAAWLVEGVVIEPEVSIVSEWARHALLAEDGTLAMGRLVHQVCDARGQWLRSEPGEEPTIERALAEELVEVGAALHAAGYFGPFGVDAYLYRRRAGGLALQRRSEINARYSMGWPCGMPGAR